MTCPWAAILAQDFCHAASCSNCISSHSISSSLSAASHLPYNTVHFIALFNFRIQPCITQSAGIYNISIVILPFSSLISFNIPALISLNDVTECTTVCLILSIKFSLFSIIEKPLKYPYETLSGLHFGFPVFPNIPYQT